MTVNKKPDILIIKLFGLLREVVGNKEVTFILNGADITVESLKRGLFVSYPTLSSLKSPFVIAVNRKVVGGTAKITPSDEVALLPLVSGG
jgi:molybdopterin converting factor small subunit